MIEKTIAVKDTTTEDIIEYLERVTVPDRKELHDPLESGWGYILDIVETPRRPGGRILVRMQRQRSIVNTNRNRLTLDCVPSQENLITKEVYFDPPIHPAVFFEVQQMSETSIEVRGGYEDLNYFQIAPFFISIWNHMCIDFGSPEGQIEDSVPIDVTPEEREVWKRILAGTPAR
jgi:hypothetical protein